MKFFGKLITHKTQEYDAVSSSALLKYLYIHRYFVASFPHFKGTDSVYVCILKSTE